MKNFAVILAAISTMFLADLSSSPARADSLVNSQDAYCTQNFAEWRNYESDSDDPNPATHELTAPDGTLTQILSCKVGEHYVRINYLSEPEGPGDCQAVEEGFVSAWVDGVKVVSREAFADGRDTCGVSDRHPRRLITKIIFNRQLHLTICHVLDDGTSKEVCKVDNAVLDRRLSDPIYNGPLARTQPALDLLSQSDDLCHSIDVKKIPENPLIPQLDYGQIGHTQTYALDIDNDGVIDRLTREVSEFAFHVTANWRWANGKTGQSYSISDAIDRGTVDDGLQIVTVNGHNYVKLTKTLGEWCYMEGRCADLSGDDITLYKVSGEGAVHELCVWRPRQRPEERL